MIPAGRAADWGGRGDRPQTPLVSDDDIAALAKAAPQWWRDDQTFKFITKDADEVPGESTPYLRDFNQRPLAIPFPDFRRIEQIPVILHDAGLEIVRPNDPADWDDRVDINKLAEIVHGSYQNAVNDEIDIRRKAGLLPKFNINAKKFDQLPAAKHESNRNSVRTIPRKLARIGFKLSPLPKPITESAEVTIDKMATVIKVKVEELAIVEHSRQNWQSLLQGYVYKPGAKSDDRRTNPCIVTWEKLPEYYGKYDRVDAKEFAGLIFEAGFKID